VCVCVCVWSLPLLLPHGSVGIEDAIAQESLKLFLEVGTLDIVLSSVTDSGPISHGNEADVVQSDEPQSWS